MTSSDDIIRVIIIWLFSELFKSHRRHYANVFTDWVGRSAPNVLFVCVFVLRSKLQLRYSNDVSCLLSCDQPKKVFNLNQQFRQHKYTFLFIHAHTFLWNVTQRHISNEASYFIVYVNFEVVIGNVSGI